MASLADLIACVFAAGKPVDAIRTKADALRLLGFKDDEHYTHKQVLSLVLRDHTANGDVAGKTIKELTSEVWRAAQLAETKERIEEVAKDIAKKTRLENLDKAKKNKAALAAPAEAEEVPVEAPAEAEEVPVEAPLPAN